MKFTGFTEFEDEIDLYRGLTGEFIPYSHQAEEERDYWNAYLDELGMDEFSEREHLKKIGKYNRFFALQRIDTTQSCTTSLTQAISYAEQKSKTTKMNPIIVHIKVPSKDLSKYIFKGQDQRGFETYDIPAFDFSEYYKDSGKILTIKQAKARIPMATLIPNKNPYNLPMPIPLE